LALFLACPENLAAQVPAYRHGHINVFPAATASAAPLRVDGDLADWKPDAFVTMQSAPELAETFSVKIAFGYDSSGLLVAARFVDQSPLVNHMNPDVDPSRGWDGDALQIRLVSSAALAHPIPATELNSDHIAHLTLWYFSDRQQPVLDVRYGMDYHGAVTLTGKESGLAYRKEDKGYTVEGRIPWSLLKAKGPPQPGQQWLFTVQPLWGDQKGSLQHNFYDCVRSAGFAYQNLGCWGHAYFVKADEAEAKFAQQRAEDSRLFARAAQSAASDVPVKYTNLAKGYVSLAICKADGQIVRTLLAKAEREAGPQTEKWDGLDDDGKPVPPGRYRLKALTHPGLKPRFVVAVHNSGNPPWATADGRGGWGGNHGMPVGAASGPDGHTYLLWTKSEADSFLIGVDQNGRKLWGSTMAFEFSNPNTALAYDDGLLYIAEDGPYTPPDAPGRGGLKVYDARTGQRVNFPGDADKASRSGVLVTQWRKSLLPARPEPGAGGEQMRAGRFTPADHRQANLVALAVGPDRVFCSLYLENQIVALDKKTWQKAETYAVERPAGLAYDRSKNTLYAVSGNAIVALDPARRGAARSVVRSGLEYPYGLAQAADGNLWVSTRGRQMQVLCFDSTGKLLRTVGVKGGRPWVGKYDPNGMLVPAGISVDSKGQLWVTEDDHTPKRISVWDTKTGHFLREFFGSAASAVMMAANSEKPEEVYIHNTRFLVDYERGTVTPDATVYRADYAGLSLPGSGGTHFGFSCSCAFRIASFQGRKFAYDGQGGVYAFDRDRFQPLFYAGLGFKGMPGIPPDSTKPSADSFVWTDIDKDGLLGENEVRMLAKTETLATPIGFGGAFYPGAGFIRGGRVFRPTGLTSDGVPIYPRPEDAPVVFNYTSKKSKEDETNVPSPAVKGRIDMFQNCMDIAPSLRSDWKEFYAITSLLSPDFDSAGGDGVYRFTRDGTIRWRYSRVAVNFGLKAPLAKPGDLFGALNIIGQAQLPEQNGGEVIAIGCYRGYYGLLNEDGLFIDQVGHDVGRSPTPDFDTFFLENFSGYFFRHPRTGKLYLFSGDSDGRILEVQGWENIRRFDAGELTLTEGQYVAAVAGRSRPPGGASGKPALTVASSTPSLDGSLKGWDTAKLARIPLDETRHAQVGLAHDRENLYALFQVPDNTPWRNASTDWRFVFKGGDAVDIQLGVSNPTTGNKRKTQPGDVRVLLAPSGNDDVVAVAMWSQVPPGMRPEPQLYKSPTGEERFQRVARLEKVIAKARRSADGYTLEVAIPWSELGLPPPAKFSVLQGDLGVLLSDGGGTQTILRRYLFNKDTGIVNDIPNEVRVLTSSWGTLVVE
jgi:hypothetical protein